MKRLKKEVLFESEQLSQDLMRKSVRGGMITISAEVIKFFLRTTGIVILARLLTPADFGLIAMAAVVLNFVEMFQTAGLSLATVQNEHISHDQVSTLFWFNIAISVFFSVCILVTSPLVAKIYGRPELTGVTAALSVSFVIGALGIQHRALLTRHMQFHVLALIQIIAQFVRVIVASSLALLAWRYWALVCANIATALFSTLMIFYFCPWLPSRPQRGTGVRGMLKFGGHVTGHRFINFFSRNADNMLIGKYIGAYSLGLYERAYALFLMPLTQLTYPIHGVAMPVLSVLKTQPERYLKYYQRLLDILATMTIPLTFYCVIEGEFLIRLFLGPKWSDAASVFRIMAITGIIQPLIGTAGLVLLTHGISDRYFKLGIVNGVLTVSAFVVGLPFGIKGVAIAYAIVNYLILIPALFYCFHRTPVTVSIFTKTVAFPLATAGLAAIVVLLFQREVLNDSNLSHLALLVIFVVVYTGGSFCRKSFRETAVLVRKNLFEII